MLCFIRIGRTFLAGSGEGRVGQKREGGFAYNRKGELQNGRRFFYLNRL
jgi:hypothetical protein